MQSRNSDNATDIVELTIAAGNNQSRRVLAVVEGTEGDLLHVLVGSGEHSRRVVPQSAVRYRGKIPWEPRDTAALLSNAVSGSTTPVHAQQRARLPLSPHQKEFVRQAGPGAIPPLAVRTATPHNGLRVVCGYVDALCANTSEERYTAAQLMAWLVGWFTAESNNTGNTALCFLVRVTGAIGTVLVLRQVEPTPQPPPWIAKGLAVAAIFLALQQPLCTAHVIAVSIVSLFVCTCANYYLNR